MIMTRTIFLTIVVLLNWSGPFSDHATAVNGSSTTNCSTTWWATGKSHASFKTRTAENTASIVWVLNHQFLLIHMKDLNTPPQYEANIYLGYDNASDRYVAHWIAGVVTGPLGGRTIVN